MVPSPPASARGSGTTSPRGRKHSSRGSSSGEGKPHTPQASSVWPPASPPEQHQWYSASAGGLLHTLPPVGALQSHTAAASIVGASVALGAMSQVGPAGGLADSFFPGRAKAEPPTAWASIK
jgi:hypothetical protein